MVCVGGSVLRSATITYRYFQGTRTTAAELLP